MRVPLTSWTWPGPWGTGRGWGIEAECVVWSCCHSTEGPSTAERWEFASCYHVSDWRFLFYWIVDWKNWLSHWWGTWQSRHGLQRRSSSPSSFSSTLACHPVYSSWTQLVSHLNTAHIKTRYMWTNPVESVPLKLTNVSNQINHRYSSWHPLRTICVDKWLKITFNNQILREAWLEKGANSSVDSWTITTLPLIKYIHLKWNQQGLL